jgi:hypothetical protein
VPTASGRLACHFPCGRPATAWPTRIPDRNFHRSGVGQIVAACVADELACVAGEMLCPGGSLGTWGLEKVPILLLVGAAGFEPAPKSEKQWSKREHAARFILPNSFPVTDFWEGVQSLFPDNNLISLELSDGSNFAPSQRPTDALGRWPDIRSGPAALDPPPHDVSRSRSITASLRRSPVVAIALKNVPERLRHRYAGRGQLTVLSAVLVF